MKKPELAELFNQTSKQLSKEELEDLTLRVLNAEVNEEVPRLLFVVLMVGIAALAALGVTAGLRW